MYENSPIEAESLAGSLNEGTRGIARGPRLAALVALVMGAILFGGGVNADAHLSLEDGQTANREDAGSGSAEAGHSEEAEAKDPSEYFMPLYLHLKQHPYFTEEPFYVINEQPPIVIEGFTNHALAIIIVGFLLIAFFYGLARSRSRNEVPRGLIQNSLESLVVWVRDDVVYKTMGETLGKRFLPLFLTQFFMILGLNLMGLLPNFDFLVGLALPTTATANVSVTLGFSLVTFFAIHIAGVKEHGVVGYVKSWVPAGLGPINGILFPVECLGHFVKPTALTIRLFANMTGGHLAILTMCGLIFFLADGGKNWMAGFPVMIVGVAFNVFLTMLEILICFIQAFVFTYLSVIFIGAAVHPEH